MTKQRSVTLDSRQDRLSASLFARAGRLLNEFGIFCGRDPVGAIQLLIGEGHDYSRHLAEAWAEEKVKARHYAEEAALEEHLR